MARQSRPMMVVPEPAPNTRTVLIGPPNAPMIRVTAVVDGTVDYACGKCGMTLLENVRVGQVQNVVVKCGKCGSFNETVPLSETN